MDKLLIFTNLAWLPVVVEVYHVPGQYLVQVLSGCPVVVSGCPLVVPLVIGKFLLWSECVGEKTMEISIYCTSNK